MSWRAYAAIWVRMGPMAGSLTMAGLALLVSPAASAPSAHAARALSINDTGHLRLTAEDGNTLTEVGGVSGTLPGTVRARLTIGTSTVRAGFTIYVRGGRITGSATTSLNPGKGEYASFGGALVVSHGSGRYAHASGTGRLSGTIRRSDDTATVQVVGRLHY